jgi:hypothetical protein
MAVLGIQREGLFSSRYNSLEAVKAFNKPAICFSDNRVVAAVKAAKKRV